LLDKVTYPNGVVQTLGYDTDMRLTAIDDKVSTTVMHIDYTLDANGNRTATDEYLNQASPCSVNCRANQKDTVGVYRNGTFYLKLSNSAGAADITAVFGGAATDIPVAGDWNGDGVDTIGVYRGAEGKFYLSDSNTSPAANYTPLLGNPGDTPITGRWTPTTVKDGIGVFRSSNGIVFLLNGVGNGAVDYSFVLGNPGDQPVAGNWTGSNADGIGVYRPTSSVYYLTDVITNGMPNIDRTFLYGNPNGGYKALAGNWTASPNGSGVGLFLNGVFYLKNQNSAGGADNTFAFGASGDIPLAGHWQAGAYDRLVSNRGPNILVTPTAAPVYVPGGNPGFENVPGMSFDGGSSATGYTGGSAYKAEAFGSAPGMAALGDTYPGLLHRRIYYTYDNLQRLTSAQYQDGTAASSADTYNFTYGYDLNSNRIRSNRYFAPTNTIQDATTYTYNEANQLRTATDRNGGVTTNQYNANGLLWAVNYTPSGGSTVNRQTLSYDSADRLSQVIDNPSGQTLGYTYNGQNDLVLRSRTLNGVAQPAVSYLNDPTGGLSQLLAEFPASGAATYYMPGAGGPLGQDIVGGGQASVQTWFARDGLGSARALFNSSATQVRLTNFDPYGTPLETTGTVGTHLGYTGALTDEVGLVYLHARYYNPVSGQFLSGDPLEGQAVDPRSWNRYGYVAGNPILWKDPGGTKGCLECGEGGGPGGVIGGSYVNAIGAGVAAGGFVLGQNLLEPLKKRLEDFVNSLASGFQSPVSVIKTAQQNSGATPQAGNTPQSGPSAEPVPTPEQVVNGQIDALRTGGQDTTRGTKSRDYTKPGGYDQAEKEFNSLFPSDVTIGLDSQGIPYLRGKLADGSTVILRKTSTGNLPTLEFQRPGNTQDDKIRYAP
jgi:RHS repeat-associated protein